MDDSSYFARSHAAALRYHQKYHQATTAYHNDLADALARRDGLLQEAEEAYQQDLAAARAACPDWHEAESDPYWQTGQTLRKLGGS